MNRKKKEQVEDNVINFDFTECKKFNEIERKMIEVAVEVTAEFGKDLVATWHSADDGREFCVITYVDTDEVFCHIGIGRHRRIYRDNIELGYDEFDNIIELFEAAPLPDQARMYLVQKVRERGTKY